MQKRERLGVKETKFKKKLNQVRKSRNILEINK